MKKSSNYVRIVSPLLINLLSYNDKHVTAIAYWPIILYRHFDYPNIKEIENHELIHHRQQLELLIIPFHVLYFLNFIYGFVKYRSYKKAYYNVCFEREAYANEKDLDYLKTRKFWSWRNWVR
jgi:hypothetical protein